MPTTNKEMYKDYVESAAFLWVLRTIAVSEPHYTQADIKELDQRIEAPLDGLMTSIELAWTVCEQALQLEQAGEVFAVTVIAFRSRDINKIQTAISAGLQNDETFKAVISALAWLPNTLCDSWISKFLNSKDIEHKYLGLSACSVRRDDPGEILNKLLQRDDCLAHAKLHARALRLIGELRRQDLLSALNSAMTSKNENIAFWASWSAILVGDKSAVNNIRSYIFIESRYQDIAIQIVFRVLPVEQARILISDMVKKKNTIRAVIKSVGVLGDPHAVKWLIGLMNQASYARLAGEAFTNITGIDLQERELVQQDVEESDETFDVDALDDYIFTQDDESLALPDSEKVSAIWLKYEDDFVVGQRYFMGKKINQELLKDIICNGYQRQRRCAALELALLDEQTPLINVSQRHAAAMPN